jgi:hypothetical protein
VRAERHCQIRQPNASELVAVLVNGRHKRRQGWSLSDWMGRDATISQRSDIYFADDDRV